MKDLYKAVDVHRALALGILEIQLALGPHTFFRPAFEAYLPCIGD